MKKTFINFDKNQFKTKKDLKKEQCAAQKSLKMMFSP